MNRADCLKVKLLSAVVTVQREERSRSQQDGLLLTFYYLNRDGSVSKNVSKIFTFLIFFPKLCIFIAHDFKPEVGK